MEPPKADIPKRLDMVMCGDHPSITKTELNIKEERPEDKQEREKGKLPISYPRISPSTSRTDRGPTDVKPRTASSEAEARRRALSLEAVSRHQDINAPANRALVQAALGSFRWPPYLVAVWVLVLLLTHVLHCLVTMLERALPAIKKFCSYFRVWTEESWHERDTSRLSPVALACVTGVLYALYCGLYALYVIALWAIEPLCTEDGREDETNVTNYVEEVNSKLNCLNK